MYAGDTGYFEYDDKYAPLCIKTRRLPTIDIVPVLQTYYDDTFSYGKKHAWAMQPSGITASEAALMLMRGRMTKAPPPYRKKRPGDKQQQQQYPITESNLQQCTAEIVKLYKSKLLFNDDHATVLQHVLQLPTHYCNDIVQRVTQQIKQFIKHYRLTTKQYTKILKSVQPQVATIIGRYYERNGKDWL